VGAVTVNNAIKRIGVFLMNDSLNNSNGKTSVIIKMNPLIKWIIVSCLVIEILLILLDTLMGYNAINPLEPPSLLFNYAFSLTEEDSIGNCLASLQTFFVGITIFFIFLKLRFERVNKKRQISWFILGVFFIYMAIDDAFALHETLGTAFSQWFKSTPEPSSLFKLVSKFPSFYWIMLLGPFFILMGLFMLIFLWNELKGIKLRKFVFIALVFFAIAILLDFIEGIDETYRMMENMAGMTEPFVTHFIQLVEEVLEMLGTTLLWYVFLNYLAHLSDNLGIKLIKN